MKAHARDALRRVPQTAVALIVVAILVGLSRAIPTRVGDVAVLMGVTAAIVASVVGVSRAATGGRFRTATIASWALLLPASLAAAGALAYPGDQGLSSAGIQFLRATEHILDGNVVGDAAARLTMYPTSFVGLAALSRLTGLDASVLLHWSWLISLPLIVGGFGLLAHSLTKRRSIGALAVVVAVSNPWVEVLPVYDGFNITLMAVWGYLVIRSVSAPMHRRGVAAALIVLAAMVTSHLFTALFMVLFAVAAGAATADRATIIGRIKSGLGTALLPTVAIIAWVAYVATRYFLDSSALVAAFLAGLSTVPLDPSIAGFSLLSAEQAAVLGLAVISYLAAGLTVLVLWAIRRDVLSTRVLTLALLAAPLVVWALATPAVFSAGTDLKEWKVRPLFGVYLLTAPLLAFGLLVVGHHGANRPLSKLMAAVIVIPMLVNAVTLPLSYGGSGPRVFDSAAEPQSVEDNSIAPRQYRALGNYVREHLPLDAKVVANWHQSSWMVGANGLTNVPIFQSRALTSVAEMRSVLVDPTVSAVAADANMLTWPSLYLKARASKDALRLLDESSLIRALDTGSQLLYVRPN